MAELESALRQSEAAQRAAAAQLAEREDEAAELRGVAGQARGGPKPPDLSATGSHDRIRNRIRDRIRDLSALNGTALDWIRTAS